MTPEAKVKKQVRDLLDKAEVYYFMPFGGGYGRAGVPDIVCCVNGFFLAIECKAGQGKTTALQERELENIRMSGGMALVVYEEDMHIVQSAIQLLKMRNGIQGIPYEA